MYYRSLIGTVKINNVRDSLSLLSQEIIAEHTEFTKNFIRNNSNSLSGLMALYQQIAPRRYILNPNDDLEYFALVDSSLMLKYPASEAVKSLHAQIEEIKRQMKTENELNNTIGIGITAPDIILTGTKGSLEFPIAANKCAFASSVSQPSSQSLLSL